MSSAEPLKVLIVEDMLTIRLLLCGQIKAALRADNRPITFYEASDGVEGLSIARRERPTIVVTDVAMPKMDGLTLCKEIKNDPAFADTAVVMMTSSDMHRSEGLAVGAAAFLRKPIKAQDIGEAMHTALASLAR